MSATGNSKKPSPRAEISQAERDRLANYLPILLSAGGLSRYERTRVMGMRSQDQRGAWWPSAAQTAVLSPLIERLRREAKPVPVRKPTALELAMFHTANAVCCGRMSLEAERLLVSELDRLRLAAVAVHFAVPSKRRVPAPDTIVRLMTAAGGLADGLAEVGPTARYRAAKADLQFLLQHHHLSKTETLLGRELGR